MAYLIIYIMEHCLILYRYCRLMRTDVLGSGDILRKSSILEEITKSRIDLEPHLALDLFFKRISDLQLNVALFCLPLEGHDVFSYLHPLKTGKPLQPVCE